MTLAEKKVQIARIAKKTKDEDLAKLLFRVCSAVTHATVAGNQRSTQKSRVDVDAKVIENVAVVLRTL